MNRLTSAISFGVTVGTLALATPTITNVTAQQRYPWNGKVDISYTVSGMEDLETVKKEYGLLALNLKVSAIDYDSVTTNVASALSGDTALTNGTHSIVWDMDADGLTFKSTNVVFTVSCETTPATYCVIDLSAGDTASSYPVSYLAEPPSGGFNVNIYKTNKLVLRRIEAGSYMMGGTTQTTLTKPFFIGLFEVTQLQYKRVTGEIPSDYSGAMRAVEKASYDAIRGTNLGTQWPSSSAVDSSSFMGKLRARTGLEFDLPTEAQWEYACRAGTTTTYSYGDSEDDSYMWYSNNSDQGYSSRQPHNVGTKLPNDWGLYDMHGNVWETCLDWYDKSLSGGIDPRGPSSPMSWPTRVLRGGDYRQQGWMCSSSSRGQGGGSTGYGFRIARTLCE